MRLAEPSTEPRMRTPATIPLRYAMTVIDDYKPVTSSQKKARDAVSRMVEWLTDGGAEAAVDPIMDGLVLLGPPGVGKSHLAAAACRHVYTQRIEEYEEARSTHRQDMETARGEGRPYWDVPKPRAPKTPVWTNVPSLIVDLRAEMRLGPDEQVRTAFARSLRDHDALVVLDDLGREKVSDWTGELVYTIVNDRYEAQLPTIATSNLSPEELTAAGYWPAISRLAEGGAIIVIEGPDHRLARPA